MQIKLQWDAITHTPEWLKLKRPTTPNVDGYVEQAELSYIGREAKHSTISLEWDLTVTYKVQYTPILWPRNSTNIYPTEMKTYIQRKTCRGMLTAALYVIAKHWK